MGATRRLLDPGAEAKEQAKRTLTSCKTERILVNTHEISLEGIHILPECWIEYDGSGRN